MVLCHRLEQQGAVGFKGVRRDTHEIDLSERPELVNTKQTLNRSAKKIGEELGWTYYYTSELTGGIISSLYSRGLNILQLS